jgi:hypothetical protein
MKKIKQVLNWIARIFGIGSGVVRDHSYYAVMFTENLKNAIRSKAAFKIVDLIPGDWDNDLRDKLDYKVVPIAEEIAKFLQIIQDNPKNSDAIEQIQLALIEKYPHLEGNFYADFAGKLNYYLADGKLSGFEAWKSAQDLWKYLFKKK